MKENKNLSFWRKACRIGAWVDLATQIIGVIITITRIILIPFETKEFNKSWTTMAIWFIVFLAITYIQYRVLDPPTKLIKGAPKERLTQDVCDTAKRWRYTQRYLAAITVFQLFPYPSIFCETIKCSWEIILVPCLFRIAICYIATKFIDEFWKESKGKEYVERHRKRFSNLLFWRKVCLIGTCMDWVSQLFSIVNMGLAYQRYSPQTSDETNDLIFTWEGLIKIVLLTIPCVTMIFFIFVWAMSMETIDTDEGRKDTRSAFNGANGWRICQVILLTGAICFHGQMIKLDNWDFWGFGLLEIFIRALMIYIATKFMREIKKVTENMA